MYSIKIKCLCLLCAILLIGVSSKTDAQITITADDFPTAIGTEYINYEGWDEIRFDVHQTGEDYVWDYSDADTLMGMLLTEVIVNPEGSIFPNTNIFMMKSYEFMGTTSYIETHSHITDSNLSFLGYRMYDDLFQDTTTIEADPGIGFFMFPMTYQSQWEGTYLQKIITNGVTTDTVTTHYTCDVNGWGSIITPYGTFDCLKLTTVWSHWNDTINNWYDYDTTFTWLSNDIPMVFQVDIYDTTAAGVTAGNFRIYESGNLGISHQERSNSITNHPNPFSSNTMIQYTLSEPSRVEISIYGSDGRKVQTLIDEIQSRGVHKYAWTPENLAKGIYFCKFISDQENRILKMIYR